MPRTAIAAPHFFCQKCVQVVSKLFLESHLGGVIVAQKLPFSWWRQAATILGKFDEILVKN